MSSRAVCAPARRKNADRPGGYPGAEFPCQDLCEDLCEDLSSLHYLPSLQMDVRHWGRIAHPPCACSGNARQAVPGRISCEFDKSVQFMKRNRQHGHAEEIFFLHIFCGSRGGLSVMRKPRQRAWALLEHLRSGKVGLIGVRCTKMFEQRAFSDRIIPLDQKTPVDRKSSGPSLPGNCRRSVRGICAC